MNKPLKYLWVFDSNNRVYIDENGIKHLGPIYKHHWQKVDIIGETNRSYVLRSGRKVPKNGYPEQYLGIRFTDEEVEMDIWMHDNKQQIKELLDKASYYQLKDIARILSYEAKQ